MRLSVRVKLSVLMIVMVGAAILITGYLTYQHEKVEAVEMLSERAILRGDPRTVDEYQRGKQPGHGPLYPEEPDDRPHPA